MTEDDAKTKWCPLARATDTRDSDRRTVNRSGNNADIDCMCIGSACMAWRISHHAKKAEIQTTECATGSAPDGEGWEIKESGTDEAEEGHAKYAWTTWERARKAAEPERGYCGAFGAVVGISGGQGERS